MTEVLPLPAAATTRLRFSSTTTALRCSSVSGRASIRSNRSRDRTSSFATNASFAFDLALSGASRNSRMPRSIRNSGASDRASGQRATRPPAAACASRDRSRTAPASRYFGGSASSASRSWTARSVPICGASVRRHQSTLALSTASANALASVPDRPDTVAAVPAPSRLTRAQRRPALTSTAPMSPRAMSAERDPKASSTLSAFTDAARASPERNMANSSIASPVRFTLNRDPGSGICGEALLTFQAHRPSQCAPQHRPHVRPDPQGQGSSLPALRPWAGGSSNTISPGPIRCSGRADFHAVRWRTIEWIRSGAVRSISSAPSSSASPFSPPQTIGSHSAGSTGSGQTIRPAT